MSISVAGSGDQNKTSDVVVDAPDKMIVVQNNVSKGKDVSQEGKTVFSESVHIVNKPVSALTKEDKIALAAKHEDELSLTKEENATAPFGIAPFGMAALSKDSEGDNAPLDAALAQQTGDNHGHDRSDFMGTGGWVFVGLFVCVLCVLIILGAIWAARRRYAKKAQKCDNKNRPDSLTAFAQFTSVSSDPGERRSFSPPNEQSRKKLPLSQRLAEPPQNRGYFFSSGYVDEISRMPEASDTDIGARHTTSTQ